MLQFTLFAGGSLLCIAQVYSIGALLVAGFRLGVLVAQIAAVTVEDVLAGSMTEASSLQSASQSMDKSYCIKLYFRHQQVRLCFHR